MQVSRIFNTKATNQTTETQPILSKHFKSTRLPFVH